jgi:myo-inositol-1-phosphate synthase
MSKIRVAIAGVGNCASSLVQGIEYYKNSRNSSAIGLINYQLAEYRPGDIEVVAAFDIDSRKVGQKLHHAIFAPPNCTKRFCAKGGKSDVTVEMAPVLDGVSRHMKTYPEDRTFVVADMKPAPVERVLRDSGADILLNYLPVGSERASKFYARCCLNAGVSLINCIPVFIASDSEWGQRFKEKVIPIVGDDIKSQLGATILHRTLVRLFEDRGIKIDRTYQLNFGGNTDFLNMLNRDRLHSKKMSKTEAVESQFKEPPGDDNIHIGPSDYVPWQKDNKVCFIRVEGRGFAEVPLNLEMRLSVEDSPNSAGIVIDAIRLAKIARDRKLGGPLVAVSSYTMKHPPQQIDDRIAKAMIMEFVNGG